MIGRERRKESMAAFAAKEQATMVEKPTCKQYVHHGHDEASCYELIRYRKNWSSRELRHGGQG